MKKVFFLLLPFVLILSTCEKNDDGPNPEDIVNIPDIEFLNALINEGVDTDGDSLISYHEAEIIDSLNIGGASKNCCLPGPFWIPNYGDIVDLDGIEAFKNLRYLDCSWNKIAELTLSIQPSIEEVICRDNDMRKLILPNNTHLFHLDCIYNQIASLDVSNNPSMVNLQCESNKLSNLDLSNNPALVALNCDDNQLTGLNLSNNTALKYLECGRNLLINLDLSNNNSLTEIALPYMPSLTKVCVWTSPFPFEGVEVYSEGSPNVIFTTDCNK